MNLTFHTFRTTATILIVVGLVLSGCGNRDNDSPTRKNGIDRRAAEPGHHFSITMQGSAASTIRTSLPEDGVSTMKRRIEQKFPAITVDPRLSNAALAYARSAETSDFELPLAFTEFVLHWAGTPDPMAAVSTLLTDSEDEEVLIEHLKTILSDHEFTHIGAARTKSKDYRWRWQIILVQRSCVLKAVPSSVAPGDSIPIMFTVESRFFKATIFATQPSGRIDTIPVGLSKSWAVASIPVAIDIGQLWIELLAESKKGPEVLALFPIEVGGQPSSTWEGATPADESWIKDNNQAVEYMVSLIDRDRKANGLSSLEVDDKLSAIARSHSIDMANTDFFGHISPSTGDISDRLRQRGYLASLAMENLARSPTLSEAEEGLMRSPGHRAALLSQETTRLGVGISHDNSDPHMFIITQIFAVPYVQPQARDFVAELEDLVRERRNLLGYAMRIDSRLEDAAQRVADHLAIEGIDRGPLDEFIEPELEYKGLKGIGWRAAAGTATAIEDLSLPRCVDTKDMNSFGLAAADTKTNSGTNFITYVVLVTK